MEAKIAELKLDIAELTNLAKGATRPKVSNILSIEIKKLETELTMLIEMDKRNEKSSAPVVSGAAAAGLLKCYDVKLTTYAWDQSDKFVKIFVNLINVQSLEKEKITCSFDSHSMELRVKELDNRNYVLTMKGLLNEIDASKSYWKVKSDMVVVFLAKKKTGEHWPHLSAAEQKAKDPKPKLESSDDPSSDMMSLMKRIYEDGDDEMKRTIAKAWTESRDKKNITA